MSLHNNYQSYLDKMNALFIRIPCEMFTLRTLQTFIQGCALTLAVKTASSIGDSRYILAYRADVQPPESHLWTIPNTRSIIECSVHCNADKRCSAHSLRTSVCRGYHGYLRSEMGHTAIDTEMVYARKDACSADGYTEYSGNHCVKYYSSIGNRQYCLEKCSQDGGRLLRVDSAEKHEVIRNLLRLAKVSSTIVHIDGKSVTQDVWKYTDGTPVTYIKWAAKMPDQSPPACLFLWEYAVWPSNYEFDDYYCHASFTFLCEKIVFL